MKWDFFSQTTTVALQSLVWGGTLIKRVHVPRTIFTVSAVGTGLVNLVIGLVPPAARLTSPGTQVHFSTAEPAGRTAETRSSVDNGSSGGVAQHLQQSLWAQRRLTVIHDTGNLSFARAANLGLAVARGQFVVLLTSDTVVLRGWLSGLLSHLQQDPAVGMIGPVVRWAEHASQAAPDARALAELEVYAERNVRAPGGTAHEVRALDMVCVALRRAVLSDVGMLDEQFDQGIVGDADYSLRLAHAGYRLLRAEDVCVHQWGLAPDGLWARADREPLFEAYRRRFEEKWGEGWHWQPLPPGLLREPATGS